MVFISVYNELRYVLEIITTDQYDQYPIASLRKMHERLMLIIYFAYKPVPHAINSHVLTGTIQLFNKAIQMQL